MFGFGLSVNISGGRVSVGGSISTRTISPVSATSITAGISSGGLGTRRITPVTAISVTAGFRSGGLGTRSITPVAISAVAFFNR